VNYVDSFGPHTLTFKSVQNGKNSYFTSTNGGDTIDILWTGSRWEAVFKTMGLSFLMFYSEDITGDNPPNTTVGNWVDGNQNAEDNNNVEDLSITGTGTGPSEAMPVTFFSFTGEYSGKRVALAWETSEEIDNERFEVERSNTAGEFQKIGEVAGNDNRSATTRYEFNDVSPLPGTNNYRLRQVDFDGQFDYSSIVSIVAPNTDGSQELLLAPNPVVAASPLNVRFYAATDEVAQLSIFNSLGQQVARYPQALRAGDNRFAVDLGKLASGNYVVRIDAGGESVTQKPIVR
jgi:hypothetical protein